MKNLFSILTLVVIATFSANAQFSINKLFGGASVGYAKPIGDFSEYAKGGLTYSLAGGYHLTEKIGVGLEYNSATTAALDQDGSTGLFGVNLYSLTSVLAKGWYQFTESKMRPYAAVGLGFGNVSEPDVTIGEDTTVGSVGGGFGANLELGVNFKGVNLAYSFNVSGKASKDPVFNDDIAGLGANYHRFSVGYLYNF